MKRLITSFGNAFRGLAETVMQERNMRIHICFCVFVTFFGFVCGITVYEWIAVIGFMGLVLAAEVFNTALESALDRVGTERNELTRRAKDAAGGGVLVSAISAAVAGCIIFTRDGRILRAHRFFASNLWVVPIFLLVLSAAVSFTAGFGKRKDKK